ncbi:MAG: hypothetical protein KJ622_13520 [Alphaproteobacteria bacterium]|nr:hypothetical protein [Alphaproteobacteria bacterium]
MNEAVENAEPKPSAIDLKIKGLLRHAKYFQAVADSGLDRSGPEYSARRQDVMACVIGAAVGAGALYRRNDELAPEAPADAMKALRSDARWLAAAAAKQAGVPKESEAYHRFSDRIVDTAIATAVAHGKLQAPNRGFAEKVEEQREAPAEGIER